MIQTKEVKLNSTLEDLYQASKGQAMQPEIVEGYWFTFEDKWGECFCIPCWVESRETLEEEGYLEIEEIKGWGARLQMPGYLDSTEWCVFDTEQEALDYLLETYYGD